MNRGPLVALALPVLATAAPAPAPVAPAAVAGAAGGFVSVALSLLLVVGVIVALAWLATRLRLTPRVASRGLRVLADVPVGPKERVVLLQVGDAQALVGVGADGVRSLGLLGRTVELPAEPPAGAFADRLRSLMQPAGKP